MVVAPAIEVLRPAEEVQTEAESRAHHKDQSRESHADPIGCWAGKPEKQRGPGAARASRKQLACYGESSAEVRAYIIPPMSGMPPPGIPAGSFSGGSATIASVVRMFLAIEAAFCSADRVTMVGSMTPSATRSPYSPLEAFRPSPAFRPRTFSTTTEASKPELSAICRIGASSERWMIEAPVRSSSS